MKKLSLILSISLIAATAWADDNNLSTTIRKGRPQPKIVVPHNEGAIQRGARMNNPLQMINPLAPAEYGDGSDFVYYDENDISQHNAPGRPVAKGIKLFGFTF